MRISSSVDKKNLTPPKIIPTPQDFNQAIQALKQSADELSKGEKIEGVAGGAALIFDADKNTPIRGTHLPNWINKPLKSELEKYFEAPVKLENDATLAGLGEANFGAGKGYKIAAYITIGTGIGGVRIVDGSIDKNALGFEPGHQIIIPDGNDCACGGKGHWETYVAGSYLKKLYHQNGEEITDPQIWNQIAKYLSIGLVNTTVYWSPDVIVLGGSVTQSIPLEVVDKNFKELLTIFPQAPLLTIGILGHNAGLYGALSYLE